MSRGKERANPGMFFADRLVTEFNMHSLGGHCRPGAGVQGRLGGAEGGGRSGVPSEAREVHQKVTC